MGDPVRVPYSNWAECTQEAVSYRIAQFPPCWVSGWVSHSFSISPGTLLCERPYSVSVQNTKQTGPLVKIWEGTMNLRNLHELWHEQGNWVVSCQQGGFECFLWKGCCSNLGNVGLGLFPTELLTLCELWLIYHLSSQEKFCRCQNSYLSTLCRYTQSSAVLSCYINEGF